MPSVWIFLWERGFRYYTYSHAVSNHFWCSMTSHPICHNCLHSSPHHLWSSSLRYPLPSALLPVLESYTHSACCPYGHSYSGTHTDPYLSTPIPKPSLPIHISAHPPESHPYRSISQHTHPKAILIMLRTVTISTLFSKANIKSLRRVVLKAVCIRTGPPVCICFVKVSISILPKRTIILTLPSTPSVTSTQNSLPRGSLLILGALMGALGPSNSP